MELKADEAVMVMMWLHHIISVNELVVIVVFIVCCVGFCVLAANDSSF